MFIVKLPVIVVAVYVATSLANNDEHKRNFPAPNDNKSIRRSEKGLAAVTLPVRLHYNCNAMRCSCESLYDAPPKTRYVPDHQSVSVRLQTTKYEAVNGSLFVRASLP